MGNTTGHRVAKYIIILLLAWFVLSLTYGPGTTYKRDGQILSLRNRITYEWKTLGLDAPNNMSEYYASVMGSPYRYFLGDVKLFSPPLEPKSMSNIRFKFQIGTGNNDSYAIEDLAWTVKYDLYSRLFLIFPRHRIIQYSEELWVSEKSKRTAILLYSIADGSAHWRHSITGKESYVYLKRVDLDTVPPISFDHPANRKELEEYWQWLGEMVGPLNRFDDDWGHRVKLSIDDRHDHALLVATSAGPDGKFDTKDDLILKRDSKTGKVRERIGFSKPYYQQ